MYESSIVVLVGQRQLTDASSGNLAANVEGLQRLTKTLTEAVARRPTAEAVVKQLDLGIAPWEVLKNLKAQQIPDTQFIQVTYQDSDPERAQQVANAVGQGVSDLIYEVSPDVNGVTATVWEPAETPNTPVSPNLILNVLLALVGSTGLSLGLVFLLEFFDNRWHTPEQIERMSRVPNLSVAPTFTAPEKALEHEKAEKQ